MKPDNHRKHPSGRPLRQTVWGTETRPRIPRDDYLNPNLRRREHKDAIGFVHQWPWEDDGSGMKVKL